MKRKALHLIFLTLIFSVFPAQGQTYPSLDIQQRMLAEEQVFLANMKAGRQHTQTLAVRAAMNGNDTALQKIRQSRNQPPVLPDGVTISRPTPDICLFAPARQTPRKRPLRYHVYPTATHLFITVPGQPTAFGEAVKDVANFLNSSE